MHIAFFSDFRAVSELRNLEVLNLAMCTGVTITGICSLVKGGKNSRCMFVKKLIMIRKNAFLMLDCIKKIDSLLPWVWSVKDHR